MAVDRSHWCWERRFSGCDGKFSDVGNTFVSGRPVSVTRDFAWPDNFRPGGAFRKSFLRWQFSDGRTCDIALYDRQKCQNWHIQTDWRPRMGGGPIFGVGGQ